MLARILCLSVVSVCFGSIASAQAPTYTDSTLYTFCVNGGTTCPDGKAAVSLIQASDGNIWGTTNAGLYGAGGDQFGFGTIFKMTPSGVLTTVYSFCPSGNASNCPGGWGGGTLIEGSDGNFYGTNTLPANAGGIYKITPNGVYTALQDFCLSKSLGNGQFTPCAVTDGGAPSTNGGGPSVLVEGSDGNFYGIAAGGGAIGTVFRMTPSGQFTNLYAFCDGIILNICTDGYSPSFGLVQGSDGYLYGTTSFGGTTSYYPPGGDTPPGQGTIFRIALSGGSYATLHSFCQANLACTDGSNPFYPLIEGRNGSYYGEVPTSAGCTLPFAFSVSGTVTILANGVSTNAVCAGPQTLGSDGNFYGLGSGGPTPWGLAYQMTPSGAFTAIYDFCNTVPGSCNDLADPGTMIQGSDGNFYGSAFAYLPNTKLPDFNNAVMFKLAVNPPLPAPIQLSLSKSQITLPGSVTLSWSVLNAFSMSAQRCFATVQNGAAGAGSWSGIQAGSLIGGAYSGSAAITPTAAGTYTYALTCGGVQSGFATLTVLPGSPNQPVILTGGGGIVNGATFLTGEPIAAGSLVSIFGAELASSEASAPAIPLTDSLGGASVTFQSGSTSIAAPILFTLPGSAANNVKSQINLQVPWELAPGTVNATVTVGALTSQPTPVTIGPLSPGIFASNGLAIAENSDGTFAWAAGAVPGLTTHAAKAGDTLVVYATGLGALLEPPPADGQNSLDLLRYTAAIPVVMIGGQPATVGFSGLSPQFVGVNQLNVVVPNVTPGNNVPIQILVGGITTSNQVTIAITQ